MDKRYIILTGGQLYNKGAQAMTFITVQEMKSRFPDKEIIVYSDLDSKRSKEEKDNYKFKILKHPNIKTLFYLKGGIHRIASLLLGVDKKEVEKTRNILSRTDMLIDISGYALGSNWRFPKMLTYTMRLALVKKYNIKAYLMPQSFGPFDFKGFKKVIADYNIKNYLKNAYVINAREQEGKKLLEKKYKLKNIQKSTDLVLRSKEIDLNNICFENKENKKIDIDKEKNNVAIIPNMKNFLYGNKEEIIKVYQLIINKLLDKNKKVYVLRHSYEDIEACIAIKELYAENENVVLLDDELNCTEFNDLIKKFDFAVASRYHSIIHSYKNGIPCIAIGWATKYHELLGYFNQSKYILDVRQDIKTVNIGSLIDNMIDMQDKNSDIIRDRANLEQENDIFEDLFNIS